MLRRIVILRILQRQLFWVVNRTLGVSEAKEQLQVWSITSTIAWAVGVVEVIALSFFM